MNKVYWGFYNERLGWLRKGKFRVEYTNWCEADKLCPEGYEIKRIVY